MLFWEMSGSQENMTAGEKKAGFRYLLLQVKS